jgi:hypothetical protein
MSPLPPLNERDLSLIVRYSLDSDEDMSQAVINAFVAAGEDIFHRPTQLIDWVNPEVFEVLRWTSERPLYLCTRIWDRRVVMTPEEVRIYTAPERGQ